METAMHEAGHGMIVYGSMDRQTLDAAYNNSAAVADSDRYLADWVCRSEALRARMPDHLNLAYCDAPRARLDFFPTNHKGAATLLFFHGGYWQRNAKEGFSFIAEGPLAHGFHRSRATPWRLRLRWTASSAGRAPRCVGFTSISRHWEAIRRGSMSAAGRPAAILQRC